MRWRRARLRSVSAEGIKQIGSLSHALKAPRIGDAVARLADQAREAGWSHEEYPAAVLDREVTARDCLRMQLPGSRPARLSTT
jgi:hypothetical protein